MKITYYLTNSSAISKIPYSAGNLIFSENERKIYLDGSHGRISYDGVIMLNTESERLAAAPVSGFYYVEETEKLWRYSNGWKCLNPTIEQSSNVLFMPYDDFPAIGQTGVLYVDGTNIYVWDVEKEDYEMATSSEELDWIEV